MEGAAPLAIRVLPRRSGVASSPSLSVRGPYHPRGRRTGRHRVKSDRAIISPLAAFEVYIPIEASSVTARRKEGKGGTGHWRNSRRGGARREVPLPFHPRPSRSSLFPSTLLQREKKQRWAKKEGKGSRGENRGEGRSARKQSACRIAGPRGVGGRIKGAERLEGVPNYDVTDRTRREQLSEM